RILDVSQVGVEVVEISDRRRARVRADDLIVAVELVAGRDLSLAIAGLPVRSKQQDLFPTDERRGIEYRLESILTLLVSDPDEDVPDPSAIDLRVPVGAARRVDGGGHAVSPERRRSLWRDAAGSEPRHGALLEPIEARHVQRDRVVEHAGPAAHNRLA